MPTFAVTVPFLDPDCCTKTFKLPWGWQLLADHRQPVLRPVPVAECSVVSMACSRTMTVWQTWLSHWPEPLHPLPAQPLMSLPLHHTHTCIHTNPHMERLLFHSPLATTFRCLHFSYYPKNNTRHLVHHTKYTHSYKHRRKLTLNANLTSSEKCVGLHWRMCVHKEPSLGTVLLLPHTNTYYCSLTRVSSGFWNKMIHLSLSCTLQLPDFKHTRFPLLLQQYLFFCLNSSHAWTV